MNKNKFFQILMAVAIVALIISSAVMAAFLVRNVSEKSYKPNKSGDIVAVMNNGQTSRLTNMDAWLEYSIVSDGFNGSNDDSFRNGNIYLSTENIMRLEQLQSVQVKASNGMFISIIFIVCCFVVLRRRRQYECIVWGGSAGVIICIITLLAITFSKSGILYGVREMAFNGNYKAMFPGHDSLPDIIPDGTGFKMLLAYIIVVFVGLVITIWIRYVSHRKSQPHRFR